MRNVSQIV